ncbi:hypothetical protein [Streptomyces chromofuscus]|uniref:hypothetical protein n=1 Tax=Streptomyces chromofuscus TaxID=42881 RepID=UPI00167BFA95|nr:hypothetical protein [Streptomyces chromofuscus]GGT04351.1 hypothetical protein GCM10010254_25980 [Streptomyces chromofuscus]
MTDDQRLAELFRHEADTFPIGPAPVDDVVRRGRVARRRRTAVAIGAITTVVALAAVGMTDLARTPSTPPSSRVTTTPRPAPSPAHQGPRPVSPYEAVDIGHGHRMALLPLGRQNFVVGTGDIGAAIEAAEKALGDNLRPDSLSSGISIDGRTPLYFGAFRTDMVPSRIELLFDSGQRQTATALTLPGDPGWGTYYAFADASTVGTDYTVRAYGQGDEVLLEQRFQDVAGP